MTDDRGAYEYPDGDGFRALTELLPDFIAILDSSGVIQYASPAVARVMGYPPYEVVGRSFLDYVMPDDREAGRTDLTRLLATGGIVTTRLRYRHKDGSERVFETLAKDYTETPGVNGILVSSRDITRNVEEEKALHRSNRALRVLGKVNSELIHANKEDALLEAICQVCVEHGGYRLAWVGYAEHDEAKTVRPVAQYGFEQGYLECANITWAEAERGRGPTGIAIRTGTTQVNRNFLTNPRMAPWRDDALRRGYQSSVALPLKDASGTFGALMLYAGEPHAFDGEELGLLQDLASDLAFGIVTLRQRERHKVAEERIAYLAYYDELTGLPNRNSFLEAVARVAGDDPAARFVVLTINVARFGDIQAGIGVGNADELLRRIAGHLRAALHGEEFVARISGDQFAVLLPGGDADWARDCARRIEDHFNTPIQQMGIPVSVQLRIGAAVAPEHGREPEALLLRSGIAARHAARAGRSFNIYDGRTESETARDREGVS